MSLNINILHKSTSKAYLKAGVFLTMCGMAAASYADTTALEGGSKRGAAAAGESIGDIKDRATGGLNDAMAFGQLAMIFVGFVLFVLAILDFTKIGKPGSDATAPKAIGKLAVGVVLAGSGYFFFSGANSAAGNV